MRVRFGRARVVAAAGALVVAGTVAMGTWAAETRPGRQTPLQAYPAALLQRGPDQFSGAIDGRHVGVFTSYTEQGVGHGGDSAMPERAATDVAWVTGHQDLVLVEGDRACRWLGEQPFAPAVDPSHRWDGTYTIGTVMWRYLRQTRGPSAITGQARAVIVAGAWEYLCRGVREDHTSPPHPKYHD